MQHDNRQSTVIQEKPLPFHRRFQFSLMLFTLAFIGVILFIFVFFSIPRQMDLLRTAIYQQLNAIAELKAEQLHLWIQQGEIALDLIMSDDQFQPDELQKLIEAGVDREQRSLQYANLTHAVTLSAIFEDILFYDTSGAVLVSTSPQYLGRSVSKEPYFQPSLENQDYLQPPFFAPDSGVPALYFTERIQDAKGKTLGVLAARLKLETLSAVLKPRDSTLQTEETYLVNAENHYLLTPSRLPNYPLYQSYTSQGIMQGLNQKSGVASYLNYEQPPRAVFGAYRWVPELHAVLLAEVSQDEAFAPIYFSRSGSILLAGLAGIILLSIGSRMSARISAPINQITAAARRLQQGDFSQRANIQAQNEAGVLAGAFNRMAGELERLVSELEQRVVEAHQARRRAEEADHLKSTFLANMSHELRTPLNAVINFTKLVQRGVMGPVNEQQAETLGKVAKHGEHLLSMINDILDMSKIEAGAMSLFIEDDVSLYSVFEDIRSTADALLISQKDVQFQMDIAPDLPPIQADRQRLTQVLLNIVSNACKFTSVGTIRLSAERHAEGIHIAVSDTGPGIPPAEQAAVFEPFRQTDAGLRQGSGTGLGMPIARQLTEAHGGRLWLQSTVGQGTTFHITLPLRAAIPAASEKVLA